MTASYPRRTEAQTEPIADAHHGDRMRRRIASCAVLAAGALLLPGTALAHLFVEPASIEEGGKQRFVLTVHNDRDAPMTGFTLTAPDGVVILGTGGGSGWNEVVDDTGTTATWSGSMLAPDTPVTLEVDLEAATVEPGPAELQGDQLYADGQSVRWPVTLTVLPVGGATDTGHVDGAAIVILAILGLILVGTILLVWRQRRVARA